MQPTIGLSVGFPNGGVEEVTAGTVGVCSPMEGATVSTGKTPRAPENWTTNQRVHMALPMVLATYVAKDGLVGHKWEERPSGLRVFNAPV